MPCQLYCVDSSALIDLATSYPFPVFGRLWGRIEGLVQENRLIGPDEVLREVEAKDDDLKAWCRRHKQMFRRTDEPIWAESQRVVERFPALANDPKRRQADPFVVGLAIVEFGVPGRRLQPV